MLVEQSIAPTRENVTQVDCLNEQAVRLQRLDPAGMLSAAEEAYQMAEAIDYTEGMARSLFLRGKAHVRLGNLQEADQALTQAELHASFDPALEADILNSHGNVFFYLKIHDKAFLYYQRSLALAKRIGNPALQAKLFNNLAIVYSDLKEYPKALDYFHMSIEAQQDLQNFNVKSIPLANMGHAYLELDDLANAELYLQRAFQTADAQNDRLGRSFALQHLGAVARRRGQREQAIKYLEESLAIYCRTHEMIHATRALLEFHRLHFAGGETELALRYLKSAEQVAEEADSLPNRLEVYSEMAYVYESLGDFQTALKYHKQCHVTVRAIEQETRQQRLRAIDVQIVADQSSKEKETYRVLSQELDRKAKQLGEAYQAVQAIGDVGRSMIATLQLECIFDQVYRHLPDLLPADVFGVALYQPESNCIDYPYLMDAGKRINGVTTSLDNRNSFAVSCLLQRRGFLVNSLREDVSTYVGELTYSMPWLPCSALMVHPLMVEDEIIGVMMVQSRKANAYSEHTLDLLGLLAAYLSIAIQIARKTDQLKEEIRQRKLAEQELRRLNGELASLSRRDGLTNIANRRLFESYLQDSWQQAQRQQGPISLLMIDIDFFKEYNDANGHLSGDEAIKQLARALQNSVKRGTDLVARFGGDEFVVLLTDTDSAGALHVARRIQQAVAVCCIPHTDSSISRLVSVSIGAATMIPGAESAPSELIARSDAALYQAGIGTQPNLRFCFRR